MDMYNIVKDRPILGILRKVPLADTIDYAEAALKGGISYFEVAMNSPEACRQITMLRDHFGDRCLIGAGTAITIDRVKAAEAAGAQFYLTPGTPHSVLKYCGDRDLPLLPGVLTPVDVAECLEYGYKTMKLFPAGDMPLSYLKDLKGPFDDTNYMAIGGVNADNIRSFFDAGCISVGLGSNLFPKDAAARKDWDACAAYAAELVRKVTE